MNTFELNKDFITESGKKIPRLKIAYHTYGLLNETRDNVIWICHALTANSDAADWWADMVGPCKCFDPDEYYIVCANYPASCYGSTGPADICPATGNPYYFDFPELTVRDMVNALDLLRSHLGIRKIHCVTGGSIGGFQAMEWAIMQPELFRYMILIACSAKASPWAIAFNESQRLALKADPTFSPGSENGGAAGLKAARSVALLSYRSAFAYNYTQKEQSDEKVNGFKAASYQEYQGEKFVKRFNAYSYYYLTLAIDSHNVGRNRNGVEAALKSVKAKTQVIGITSDQLFPLEEQRFLAEKIPGAEFHEIYSLFGHDGFLIEYQALTDIIHQFIN